MALNRIAEKGGDIMNSNNFNGGCCGSHRQQNVCHRLGPFNAVDAACLPLRTITGTIIPYASGATPVALSTIAGGLLGTTSYIGFGTAVPGIALVGTDIILTGLINEAFSVPRPGSITSISAAFQETLGITVIGTATIRAQIYRAVAGSNTFSPTSALVDLGPISGILTIGALFSAASSSFAPVPVAVGDRLLLKFSATATGVGTLINAFVGSVSAGITIE